MLSLLFSLALASTSQPTPELAASFEHADHVVVGHFTGELRSEILEVNASDPRTGAPVVREVERLVHSFAVTDVLDGELADVLEVKTMPWQDLPEVGAEVAMGVSDEADGGVAMLYGRFADAGDDEALAEAEALAEDVREARRGPPDPLVEELSQLTADDPWDETAPVEDDPFVESASGTPEDALDAGEGVGQDAMLVPEAIAPRQPRPEPTSDPERQQELPAVRPAPESGRPSLLPGAILLSLLGLVVGLRTRRRLRQAHTRSRIHGQVS